MTQTLAVAAQAVLAATIAGAVCGALIGLAMTVGATVTNWQLAGWRAVLIAPATGLFTGYLGAISGAFIGVIAGATISITWAIIQRYFRRGFASDLSFIAVVIVLYALRENQLDRMVLEQLGAVLGIIMFGSVIAAVVFRKLLGLPLALVFRGLVTD